MAGKLDEISVTIGKILGGLDALTKGVEDHRKLTNVRHEENRDRLDQIEDTLKDQLTPLATTVADMKPIVADYKENRSRAIGVLLAITGLASGLGFFASELKSWFVHH